MLVHLDFGDSNEKFFQVGKSVTVGNFIWIPYTTISDVHRKEDHSRLPFSIYVECKSIDPTMSFECVADIDVVQHGYSGNTGEMTTEQVFNDAETKSPHLRECYNVGLHEAREYSISVNVKSFEIFPTRCSTSPKPDLTDIELIVGDKTFYASKHILAQHSKKFYEMIYGADQAVDRLEITDVSPEDFLLFLEILYDCEKGVRWSSIEKIADHSILYESTKCLRECEIFLIRQNVCFRDPRCYNYKRDDEREKITFQYCQKYWFKNLLHQILHSLTASKIREKLEEEDWIEEKLKEALTARLAELEVRNSRRKNKRRKQKKLTEVNTIQPFIAMIDQAPIDFSQPRDNLTDIVLSVGDKKYHVSKKILANASAYFYAMFYGNFNEKNENVIELKGVNQAELEEFLQHVYNPDRNHNGSSIKYLLKLCHFFDASYNLRQCQKYILNSGSFNDAQKIYMAKKHHLTYLFDQVVFKYQTMDDLKDLTLMKDFYKLNKAAIADITMKILENHTGSNTVNR